MNNCWGRIEPLVSEAATIVRWINEKIERDSVKSTYPDISLKKEEQDTRMSKVPSGEGCRKREERVREIPYRKLSHALSHKLPDHHAVRIIHLLSSFILSTKPFCITYSFSQKETIKWMKEPLKLTIAYKLAF